MNVTSFNCHHLNSYTTCTWVLVFTLSNRLVVIYGFIVSASSREPPVTYCLAQVNKDEKGNS